MIQNAAIGAKDHDVVIVDIIAEVVSNMKVYDANKVLIPLYYECGRAIQILKPLIDKDNSITLKDTKYPLIAMFMPIKETRNERGYYSVAKIDRIVLATITTSTDDVRTRYLDGGTFKSILYPIYTEFLLRLAQHPNVIRNDSDAFTHVKMDNPGTQPIGEGMTDYVDSIEILNLEFTLTQIKTQ